MEVECGGEGGRAGQPRQQGEPGCSSLKKRRMFYRSMLPPRHELETFVFTVPLGCGFFSTGRPARQKQKEREREISAVGLYYYSGKTEEEASSGHTKHEHNFEVHRLTMSTKKYLRTGQKPEFCAEHSKEGTVHIDRNTRSAQHPVVEAVSRNRTGFEVNGSRGQHPPQVGNAAPNKAYMRHIDYLVYVTEDRDQHRCQWRSAGTNLNHLFRVKRVRLARKVQA